MFLNVCTYFIDNLSALKPHTYIEAVEVHSQHQAAVALNRQNLDNWLIANSLGVSLPLQKLQCQVSNTPLVVFEIQK